MLATYDVYAKGWDNNLKQSLKARDSLRGEANERQRENDKTIQERLDDDCLQKKQMREVFEKAFKYGHDQTVTASHWVGDLRKKETGLHAYKRTVCCDKREELNEDLTLQDNKRSFI